MGKGLIPPHTGQESPVPTVPSPGAVSIPGNYYYSTEEYYYDNTTATPATYVYEFDSYEVSWYSTKNQVFLTQISATGMNKWIKPADF